MFDKDRTNREGGLASLNQATAQRVLYRLAHPSLPIKHSPQRLVQPAAPRVLLVTSRPVASTPTAAAPAPATAPLASRSPPAKPTRRAPAYCSPAAPAAGNPAALRRRTVRSARVPGRSPPSHSMTRGRIIHPLTRCYPLQWCNLLARPLVRLRVLFSGCYTLSPFTKSIGHPPLPLVYHGRTDRTNRLSAPDENAAGRFLASRTHGKSAMKPFGNCVGSDWTATARHDTST